MNYLTLKDARYLTNYAVAYTHEVKDHVNELGNHETLNYLNIFIKKLKDESTCQLDCLSLVYKQGYLGEKIIAWTTHCSGNNPLHVLVNNLSSFEQRVPESTLYYNKRYYSQETGVFIGIEESNEYMTINHQSLYKFTNDFIGSTESIRDDEDSEKRNSLMVEIAHRLALKHFSMDAFNKVTVDLWENTVKRLNSKVVEGMKGIGRKASYKNIINIGTNKKLVYRAGENDSHIIEVSNKLSDEQTSASSSTVSLLIKPLKVKDLRKGKENIKRIAIQIDISGYGKSYQLIRPVSTTNIRPLFYLDDVLGQALAQSLWYLSERHLAENVTGIFIPNSTKGI